MKMKVKVYCINKYTDRPVFGLKLAEEGNEVILPDAPNKWKTEKGAINWARKNGLEVIK
jgi:hypothetical protein